jgi:hypothetical protein
MTQAIGQFEPSLTCTILRACRYCGARHPQAEQPPVDSLTCLSCGEPVEGGQSRTVPAVFTGLSPSILAGRLSLWLGRLLAGIARTI